jgi:hypothetical protein
MLGRGQNRALLRTMMCPAVGRRGFRAARVPLSSLPLARRAIADDGALAREEAVDVNKITWTQAGRVTDPGRYMFKFGWLTITADDLAIWQAYPNAAFTLIGTTAPAPVEGEEQPAGEEFRLGIFELPTDPDTSDREK